MGEETRNGVRAGGACHDSSECLEAWAGDTEGWREGRRQRQGENDRERESERERERERAGERRARRREGGVGGRDGWAGLEQGQLREGCTRGEAGAREGGGGTWGGNEAPAKEAQRTAQAF